jgi:hypothetical protein
LNNTRQIKTFIVAMALAALGAAGYAGWVSHSLHPYLAPEILALAVVTSRLKVKLPGINGNMSVNLPFLLTAIVNLSAAEAIAVTCISTAVQCWPRKDAKFNGQQMAFNLAMMAFAAASACWIVTSASLHGWTSLAAGSALGATMLFLGQTVPVAAIISLSEKKSAGQMWWNLAQLSFPYYVVGAGVSTMVQTVSVRVGWELALAAFPVMYCIHHSYSLYFRKMAEASHAPALARAAGAGA